VRTKLVLAILLTVVLSWILGTGITNYFNYLSLRSLRQQMMDQPGVYGRPIAVPGFDVVQFFLGPAPMLEGPSPGGRRGPPPWALGAAPRAGLQAGPGPDAPFPAGMGARRGHPVVPGPAAQLRWLLLRLTLAVGFASIAGIWLGRRFTRPLKQLAEGAAAFQSGEFSHQTPASGGDEFAAVAGTMNEMALQVSRQIARLEDDAERRRQFLADVAHELRSPVATLRTMAGALQDGVAEEPERKERAISALVRTSDRLLRLVTELMELAKLDLNELPLHRETVDLRDLAESVMQSREAEAAAAGVKLNSVEPGSSVIAYADADRMTQVLDNLIDNAISYAGAGAEVSVGLGGGDPVRITVSDTGRGIPASDLPKITDSFYRADTARTPSDLHFGLGLSIVRRLAEAHGGSLSVFSEEGRGTEVVVTIPGASRTD